MKLLCLLLGHRWMLVYRDWIADEYPLWSEGYECERCHKRKVVY